MKILFQYDEETTRTELRIRLDLIDFIFLSCHLMSEEKKRNEIFI